MAKIVLAMATTHGPQLHTTVEQWQLRVNADKARKHPFRAGVYSFNDLLSLGFVKNRTDLHRKQRRYGFPSPVKLGERQAGFLRAEVHGWVRDRAAASRTIADHLAE